MPRTKVFHEEVFYAYFRPFRHPAASYDIWGGDGLETFGDDFQIGKRINSSFLWTVVDGGEGADQLIAPGLHYVNRVCYLLTSEPHDWAPIEFRVGPVLRAITARRLACRITTLRRVMLLNQIDKHSKT